MKVTGKQQDLSRCLSTVLRAVEKGRPPIPILSNVLLTVDQGRLKAIASNLEIGITCWIEVDVEEEGKTTLPAKLLAGFVNSLPPAPVEIEVAEDTHVASITSAWSIATINGTEPSEFPLAVNTESESVSVQLDATLLKQMIEQVAIAASKDMGRPIFKGISVEVNDDMLTLAACDSFRLAVHTTPLSNDQKERYTIIIPADALSDLSRVLPDEGMVDMMVTDNKSRVLFRTEALEVTLRLLSGTYPNYRSIIPTQLYTARAVITTKELAAVVESVTPFASDESHIITVKVKPGKNKEVEPGTLTIEGIKEGVGKIVSTLPIAVDGGEQSIVLNAKYLADYLKVVKAPSIALELISPVRPGVLKPVGIDDYTYVIMPMNNSSAS